MLAKHIIEEIAKPTIATIESLKPILESASRMRIDLEKMLKATDGLAEVYGETVAGHLVAHGWFVGSSLTARQVRNLANVIDESGHEQSIETFMIEHMNYNLDRIESSVIQEWATRSTILSQAFSAHRNEQYALSIPVMLAQADGMAYDVLNAYVFTDFKGKIAHRTEELIELSFNDRPLVYSFLGILLDRPAIRDNTDERDTKRDRGEPFSPLNRHGVLHGIDLDYACEPNGLRAISLIEFLTQVSKWKSAAKKPTQ